MQGAATLNADPSLVVSSNVLQLTITGLDFSTDVSTNLVRMKAVNAPSGQPAGTVTSLVFTTANTQAVVTLSALTLANAGALLMEVGIPGFPGQTVWSNQARVATVVAAQPQLLQPSALAQTTHVDTITCGGVGFDSLDPPRHNLLAFWTLSLSGNNSSSSNINSFTSASSIAAALATTATTRDALVLQFSYLIPDFEGDLYGSVEINQMGVSSPAAASVSVSDKVLVASLTPAAPQLTFSDAALPSIATSLVVQGLGLNNVTRGRSGVRLRAQRTGRVVGGAVSVEGQTTRTAVTLEFLDLAAVDAGPLMAQFEVDYGGGRTEWTPEQQVATVEVRALGALGAERSSSDGGREAGGREGDGGQKGWREGKGSSSSRSSSSSWRCGVGRWWQRGRRGGDGESGS
jgi:hypothetical protein